MSETKRQDLPFPKLLAYLRYSPRPKDKVNKTDHDGDSEAQTIFGQRKKIETHLNGTGPEVVYFADELISARKVPLAKRPQGALLLQQIAQGERNVIVSSMDRLFRNTIDGLTVLTQWQELGVRLTCCSGVAFDLGTADGYMLATFKLGIDAYEPMRTAERTSEALCVMKSQNKRTGRYPRFGYCFDPDKLHSKTNRPYKEIIEPQEQKLIRDMQLMEQHGNSFSAIARTFNERNITAHRRGKKRWHAAFVSKVLTANS